MKHILLIFFLLVVAFGKSQTPGGANSAVFRFTKEVWLNPTIILTKQNFEASTNVKLKILPRFNANDTSGSSDLEKAFDKFISALVYNENVQGSIKIWFNPSGTTKPFSFSVSEELHCKFTPVEKDSIEEILNRGLKQDANLNDFKTLPFDSLITVASNYCKRILQNRPGACGPNPNNTFSIEKINTSPAKITFDKASNSPNANNGGIDQQQYSEFAGNYNSVQDVYDGNFYAVPWKALSTQGNDNIRFHVKKRLQDFDMSRVKFMSADSSETYNITVNNDSTLSIQITSSGSGTMKEVVAWYSPANNPTQHYALGLFNVYFYEPDVYTVVLVNLGGATLPAATQVRDTLNKIYGNTFISWNVETAQNYTLTAGINKNIHIESSSLLSNYMPDMQDIVSDFKDRCANYNSNDDKKFYLLFGCTNDGNLQGYMPRARNTGFIFSASSLTSSQGGGDGSVYRTIAHELGHGAFHLNHIFCDDELGAGNRGLTNNIMDYSAGNALYKHQWDLIHNPGFVGWFDGDDEEGAAYGSTKQIPGEFWQQNDTTVTFITPSKKLIKLPSSVRKAFFIYGLEDVPNCPNAPAGTLLSFSVVENNKEVFYTARIENNQLLGYFNNGIPFTKYVTPQNKKPYNTFTNKGVYRLPLAGAAAYYNIGSLGYTYYGGETEGIIDISNAQSCDLASDAWELVKDYPYSEGNVGFGLNGHSMNPNHLDIMKNIGDKNKEAILLTKAMEYWNMYNTLGPMVSAFGKVGNWSANPNLVAQLSTYIAGGSPPIDYFILGNMDGQSFTTGGYFEYQVDSANWYSLPKEELLIKYLNTFQRVMERSKSATNSVLQQMKAPVNCMLNLSQSENTIRDLNANAIDLTIKVASAEDLSAICPGTRAQLVARLLETSISSGNVVTGEGREAAIYKLLIYCKRGAETGDFLIALENVKDKSGKHILKDLVSSVDDMFGTDYNTLMLNYFITAYTDLLMARTTNSQYYNDNVFSHLLTNNSSAQEIADRTVTFNYVNFVKRLFKQIVANQAGGLGSLVLDDDQKSTVDYDEQTGLFTYKNFLVKGFETQSTERTLDNLHAFEPFIIDAKGNLLDIYEENSTKVPYYPAFVLYFAEEKGNSKTTQDALQTAFDVATLVIPGTQGTVLLKVLNYADKLSSVASICATGVEDDNPKLASALNLSSAVLGIASFTGDISSFKAINTLEEAGREIKITSNLSPAVHQQNVIELCQKFTKQQVDAGLAAKVLDIKGNAKSKELMVDILEAEKVAAQQANKFDGVLKQELEGALSILRYEGNLATASAITFMDELAGMGKIEKLGSAYKKGSQTVAHFKDGELVMDAITDVQNLSDEARLIGAEEMIAYKKADNAAPTSGSMLTFEDAGVIKCIDGINCFAANTLVKTNNGLKPIQDISTQDSVLSYTEQNGKTVYNKVSVVFKKTVNKLNRIIAGTDTLLCTPEHKFYSAGKWLRASALGLGMMLQLSDGTQAAVNSNITIDTNAAVYNFEVEQNHNYYVGRQSILAHNNCEKIAELVESGKLLQDDVAEFAKDFAGNNTLLNQFVSGELEVDAWKVLKKMDNTLAKEDSWLKSLSNLGKDDPQLYEDLLDPDLFAAYKNVRDNPATAWDMYDVFNEKGKLTNGIKSYTKSKYFRNLMQKGLDFEEFVSDNLSILRTKILSKYPNVDVNDYAIFEQVQIKTGQIVNNVDEYFVADFVLVRKKTVLGQEILDMDNGIVLETKLSDTTPLTTPQTKALAKVKTPSNTFDIRTISKESKTNSEFVLGSGTDFKNLKITDYIKVNSNGIGSTIQDVASLK